MKNELIDIIGTSIVVTITPVILLSVLFGSKNLSLTDNIMLILIFIISILVNSMILKVYTDDLK